MTPAPVLSVLLRTAVEWKVIDQLPGRIKLLKPVRTSVGFYDFEQFERLVEAAAIEGGLALLIVLLGCDAGLRCGEMMALEWADVDFANNQLVVRRSEWKGHTTMPKGGRIRYVPLTARLAGLLQPQRAVRERRVLLDGKQCPLTQRKVQGLVRRAARRADLRLLVRALRHTFCSHLMMEGAQATAIQKLAGHQHLVTTERYMHLAPGVTQSAIRLLDRRHDANRGNIVATRSA
jgi:integrase